MSLITNKFFKVLLSFLLLSNSILFAQTSTVSPYSIFGIGDLIFDGYANQFGMAGVSNAGTSVSKLNFNNPASYAYDTLMVLDFGVKSERLLIKQTSNTNKQFNTTNNNFSMGFPLKQGIWGFAFGFVPYSGVGYKLETTQELDTSTYFTSKYLGDGGIIRYYFGSGIKITKNLSLGVNANYLYGTIDRTRKILYSNSTYFDNKYLDEIHLSDFYFEFGLHYNGKLNDRYNYAIGLTGAPSQNINAKRTTLWQNYRLDNFNDLEVIRDTITYVADEKGDVSLPKRIGFGLQINNKRSSFGLDVNWQDWSSYSVYGQQGSLKNSLKIALGGQIIPYQKSLSYFGRMQYRGGLYFNQTYLDLRSTRINDYGITVGAGLPFKKSYGSMFNFGLAGGIRGTTSNSLVREQYLRLIFGVTLNEDWFRKQKFD